MSAPPELESVEIAPLFFQSDPTWIKHLRRWARRRPRVHRVWVFGSRVTGHRTPKPNPTRAPDLDVAYELFDGPGHAEDAFTYAMHIGRRWQTELSRALDVNVDLQFLDLTRPNDLLPGYVAASGRLIYEAATPTASAGRTR